MQNFVSGYQICAKASKLLYDVTLMLSSKKAQAHEILILTLSKVQQQELLQKKKNFDGFEKVEIASVDEAAQKIAQIESKDIQQSYLCESLIEKISQELFFSNASLRALLKAPAFFRELYSLFRTFKKNDINPKILFDTLNSLNLGDEDKKRLSLIFEVFEKYNKTLFDIGAFDYYDCIKAAVCSLEKGDFKKYKYVFVYDYEMFSHMQSRFAQSLGEEVFAYGDLLFSSEAASQNYEADNSKCSKEIFKRALFFAQKCLKKTLTPVDFSQCKDVKYLEFEGIYDEISWIAQDIKQKIASEDFFSDFAIVLRDRESTSKLAEFFKVCELPIDVEFYCEEFQNFKMKILRTLNICTVAEKLGLCDFSKAALDSVALDSKAEEEILFDELGLYFENLLSEIFDDISKKDRFVFLHSNSKQKCFLSSVWKNLDILDDADKKRFFASLNSLTKCYNAFKKGNFEIIFETVRFEISQNQENSVFERMYKKLLNKVYALKNLHKKINFFLDSKTVINLLDAPYFDESQSKNCVSLCSFSEIASREFRHVYIPFLNEKNIPRTSKALYFVSHQTNELFSCELKKNFFEFTHLIESDEEILKSEAKLFYETMCAAKESVTLSFHCYEDKKKLCASSFFELLSNADSSNYEKADGCFEQNPLTLKKTEAKKLPSRVFSQDEVLKLNASSIEAFLSCPRKYFYKNVLNLKEESAFKASYGTVVHFILEVFTSSCLDFYTPQKMKLLAEALFDAKHNPKKACESGFSEFAVSLINATDDLALFEMKNKFFSALEQMEQQGFFEDVPDSVVCEKDFEFALPGVDNVVINGKIDAIVEKNGRYCLVDYKTGKCKKELAYYFSDYGLNFEGTFGQYKGVFSENNVKNYQYQIPLYYLALKNCEHLSEFGTKLDSLGLRYIHPASQEGGYKEDKIDASLIEEKKERIISNLVSTVVNKIRQTAVFEKTDEKRKCENCSYAMICSKEGDDDSE